MYSLSQKYLRFSFVAGKKPVVKSVDMTLINDSDKIKLVCRVRDFDQVTKISWKKDGQPLGELPGKIRIRSKR